MPGCVRLSDFCTGHGSCYPPRKSVQGSSDVFTNGLPNHRLGDSWAVHGTGDCPPHSGKLVSGSPDVFTNGLPQGRIGDSINCGSAAATGSDDVIIN